MKRIKRVETNSRRNFPSGGKRSRRENAASNRSKMYSSSFRLTNRDIDLAFEARHLFLVFQPRISLGDATIMGAEAYVRWTHPEYGLLPPGLFLSFFERRERAGELTRYVVERAAETLAFWQEKGQNWPVSINLSASDVNDPGLAGALDGIMAAYDLDPAYLTIEIPEGAIARSPETATHTIRELRRMGFKTALDGGGAVIVPDELLSPDYFNEVKIGGASIIRFAQRLKNSGIGFVGKRVALASDRGMDATAVGVENEITLAALRELGFSAAQGAYICRPMKAEELVGWSYAPQSQEDEELLLLEPMSEAARQHPIDPPIEDPVHDGGENAEETELLELTAPLEEEPVDEIDTPLEAEEPVIDAFDPEDIELDEYEELEDETTGDDDSETLAAIRNEVMSLAASDELEGESAEFEPAPDEPLEEDTLSLTLVEPGPVDECIEEEPPVAEREEEEIPATATVSSPDAVLVEAVADRPEEFILDYTALDFELPGEEIRMVAWRIDRVCLFPGRELVRRMPLRKRRRPPTGKHPAHARSKASPKRRTSGTGKPRRPAPPRKRQRRKAHKRSFLERALGL